MKTLSFSVAKLRHFSRSLSVSVRFSQIMRDKSVSVRFCPFPWLGSHRSMPNCSAMYFTAIGGRSLVVGFTPSASCPERRYLRLPLQVSAIGFAGSCVEGVSQEERDNVTIYYSRYCDNFQAFIRKNWTFVDLVDLRQSRDYSPQNPSVFSGIRFSCPANGFNDEVWYVFIF